MKKAVFLLTCALFTVLFAIFAFGADISVLDGNGNEYNHTNYTFFLPSHISPSAVNFKLSSETRFSYTDQNGTNRAISSGDTVDLRPYKTVTGDVSVYILSAKLNGTDYFIIFRFASSLPSVNIETSISPSDIMKYEIKDESVKTTVVDRSGETIHSDSYFGGKLRVRGNATAAYLKKPFQVKLTEKADLFGMGSDKTWLLLANYDDQSLLRNSIMYRLGKFLGMQTTDFISVDLFINGEYYGVYLLCEKVEIDGGRLNIFDLEKANDLLNFQYREAATVVKSGELIESSALTEYRYIDGVKNPSDISGGYLVELDNNYYKDELCYFTTEFGSHYVIKSPEYPSREEVEYIAKLFADMEEAIMASDGYNRHGKHYTEYVDIDTLASAYIMQEFGRNYDSGSSSMFFYKDIDKDGITSKIFKGPLWDCDNTLGNIHKNGASSTKGYWAKDRSIWAGLTKKEEFNSLVSEKFTLAYDFIFDTIDEGGFLESEVDFIGDSIHMEIKRWGSNNYDKWPLYYDGTHYDRWQSSPVFNFRAVYSDGVNRDDTTVIGYLCEHIEARANWLAQEWDCDVSLRQRIAWEKPSTPEAPPSDNPSGGNNPSDNLPSDNPPSESNPGEIPPSGVVGGGSSDNTQAAEKKGFFELFLEIISVIIKAIVSFFASLFNK